MQPTIFIINTVFINITLEPKVFFKELIKLKTLLLLLAVNCFIMMTYPYPIIDLIEGLLLQGSHLSSRNDGDFFTYYIRSDFLPLFGATFVLYFYLALKRTLTFALLLPFIYFYGLKAPPTFYNLLPLYIAIILYLISNESLFTNTTNKTNKFTIQLKSFFWTALLALTGFLQGISRDIYSLIVFDTNPYTVGNDIENLKKSGYTVCTIPGYTTAVFPKLKYAVDVNPTLEDCALKIDPDKRVDIIQISGSGNRNIDANCKRTEWSNTINPDIPTIFNTESGYTYKRCFK